MAVNWAEANKLLNTASQKLVIFNKKITIINCCENRAWPEGCKEEEGAKMGIKWK